MKLFQLDTETVIINEVVINEVRLRECLWNPRNACYKNKTEKYKAWEEIAVAVLPKYRTCSEDNKRRIVRAVQSRWKTALDAYMKCRLTETKKPTYKARQHRFIYNKLRFLERVKDLFEDIDKDVNNKVKTPTLSAGGISAGTGLLAAGQVAVRPADLTKEPPNKGVPLGKSPRSVPPAPCVAYKDNEEGSNSFVGSLPGGKASSACGAAAGTALLAAGQVAVRPADLTKEPPNNGVPLGKSRGSVPPALCVALKDNVEGSNSFVDDNFETESTSTACDADDSEGSAEIMDFDIDIHDDFKEKIKHLATASLPGGKESSACGIATGTALLAAGQVAVRPADLTKEPPNKGVPLGKSRGSLPPALCVALKDNMEGSNSFVGDNSECQSTCTACDADDSEGTDEIMDFDIDIHDDFKEKIKHLVTDFDGIDDKIVNDNINQECLSGTSSLNNGQKDPLATADVTKPQKNCTSENTFALQTDDQLFFNSLAPLIDNFDIQQKLKLRSKIMEVVMEVGKIGPVNIKQERDT